MHTISWSNGHVDSANTWRELFDLVRVTQWTVLDEDEFRATMAKRAWRWSGTQIDMGAPYARFFRELERAKLIVIEKEGI